MIKILFYIDSLSGGGAEKVLCNLVNAMDQSKFDITVQTLFECDPTDYLTPGIRYRYLFKSRSGFAAKLTDLWYRSCTELKLTYPLYMKDDYDIECAYLEMGTTKVMAASTNKKAKKLAWVHCDLEKKMGDTEAFVKKTADWYRKFDKVICVSEDARKSFVDLFGNAPESLVLYNTIDESEIHSKADAYAPQPTTPERVQLVYAGRLSAEKDPKHLLLACRELRDRGYSFELNILGEGAERPALERLIEQSGLTDFVHLHGFCDNPYPWLKHSDLIVCSSRYEGLSTVAVEAMILGRPFVTTPCSGMREILGDSEFGLIADDTEGGLSKALARLLDSPALREYYAAKAKERAKAFSRQAAAATTELFFEELVQEKNVHGC